MLALSSCREELSMEENKSDGKISFHIQSDSELQTKSSGHSIFTDYEICGETMTISLTTSDNTDCIYAEDIGSRGPAFDNSDGHQITAISVTSILADGSGGKLYFTEDVDIDGGCGVSDRFWPETPLSFFAYSVSKDNVKIIPAFKRENNQCIGSFSYALPTAAETSPRNDATAQPDVVFAITPDLTRPADGCVDLEFHHALSALVFKVGKMPTDVILNSIAIGGVYSSGDCNMTPGADNNVIFEWSGQKTLGKYTESIGKKAVAGEQMGGEDAIFMMIPQTLGDAAKLILSFSISGQKYSLEKSFKEIIAAWEADKKYVFTIGLPDEIEVEVEDQVVGAVKQDVTITNTGSSPGYVRAAIIGYWVNNKGDVTMPWLESDGEFDWGNEWSQYWKKGSDGFYYYLHPVPAKAATEYPLFDTYTLNTSTNIGTNHAFLTLELNIAVQIIMEKDKALWPEIKSPVTL